MEKQAKLQEATCEQIAHTSTVASRGGGMRTRVEGTPTVSLSWASAKVADAPEGWTAGQYLNDIAERSQNLIMATYLTALVS